ncbi:MAG: ABC transporter substrate-binding protein [Mycobacteriales bacterium]
MVRTGSKGLIAGALLSLAAVSACGGSSGGAKASGSSGSSGSSGGGSVTYGVLSCFTGRLASLGEAMLQGSEVAQKAVNDAGGVNGKQVQLVHADTSCDLADAVPATQNLLSKNVVGVIGPESQEIAAVEPILKQNKIVDEFQGGDTGRDHQSDPFLFRDSPSDSQLGVAMALYAHQKGYKTAALLFYNDVAAQTLVAPIKAAYAKLGGTITATVNLAPGQTSYRAQVQQVLAGKPDVIFTQTDAPTAAVLFRELQQANNLATPIIGTDVTSGSDYLKAITYPVAKAHLVSVYGASVTGAGNDAFTKIFTGLHPGQQPLANANYAYDAVISMALAQQQAKSTDGEATRQAMTKVTNPPGTACSTYADCLTMLKAGTKINYEGASGSLDYNQYNNTFGPYGAFVSDDKGNEQQVATLSAADLAAATP